MIWIRGLTRRSHALNFSKPGKPTDNAFIEAFNGRFRAECVNAPLVRAEYVNAHWLVSLADAEKRWKIIGSILQRRTSPWGNRPESADYVVEPRRRSQPAYVSKPEKSSFRRSKDGPHCNLHNQIRVDIAPSGRTETKIVSEIARLTWRKQNLGTYTRNLIKITAAENETRNTQTGVRVFKSTLATHGSRRNE